LTKPRKREADNRRGTGSFPLTKKQNSVNKESMTPANDNGIKEIAERLLKFREERDWGQFHSPKNLAISITLEAAELLEHFQWARESETLTSEKKEEVAKELADIFNYVIILAEDLE
jgi:NTP pyrophosphatase (non-canonical NTP hydrolase)